MRDIKALVIWVTDSGGTTTIHANKPDLNFEKSYLGRLEKRTNWGYIPKGDEWIECKTYAQAMAKLERAAIRLLQGQV